MTQGKIRNREHPSRTLQKFEPGFNFATSRALLDKVELSYTVGTVNMIGGLRHASEIFYNIGNHSRFFRTDGLRHNSRLQIRKVDGRGPCAPDWLVAGQIKMEGTKLRAYLKINPMRFFAHNTNISDGIGRLTIDHQQQCKIGRKTLDRNDNMVLNERMAEFRRIGVCEILKKYLCSIHTKICEELVAHTPDTIFNFHDQITDWSVSGMEVAWEYQADNSIVVAKEFGEYLAAEAYRDYGRANHEGNITCYTFQGIRAAQDIIIYAKTEDRIRIEYRFKRNPKKIYNKRLGGRAFPSNSEANLYEFVEELICMAANELERLRGLHERFANRTSFSCVQVVSDLRTLAYCVSGRLGTSRAKINSHRILNELVANGRITDRGDGYICPRVIKDLTKSALIVPFPKKPRQNREYGPGRTLARIIPLLRRETECNNSMTDANFPFR